MWQNAMKRENHMCEHIDDEGILQFEINHEQGQTPVFTCRVCKGEFSQREASAIIEGLL